jgi:hypothetical protein
MSWNEQDLRSEIAGMFGALEIPVVDRGEDAGDGQGRQRMFGYHVHRHLNTTREPASDSELAQRRTTYRLSRPAKRLGRPLGAKSKDKPEKAEALRLLSEGLSLREAAKRVGVDRVTVLRWRNAA